MHDKLKIANGFGNVDIRTGVPKGYTHVSGERLAQLCRKLGIKFAPALTGFTLSYRRYEPDLDGVIVSSRSAAKLLAEMEAREKRKKTPEQLAAARKRRQQRDIERFAEEIRQRFPNIPDGEDIEIAEHACEIGSGRVGRSSMAEDPVRAAVIAHIRHSHTDYDAILDGLLGPGMERWERDEIRFAARDQVREQIDEILAKWTTPTTIPSTVEPHVEGVQR